MVLFGQDVVKAILFSVVSNLVVKINERFKSVLRLHISVLGTEASKTEFQRALHLV